MSKANEPAYPVTVVRRHPDSGIILNEEEFPGLTKRDKLAMDIYVKFLNQGLGEEPWMADSAKDALRAADIFFDELNK